MKIPPNNNLNHNWVELPTEVELAPFITQMLIEAIIQKGLKDE